MGLWGILFELARAVVPHAAPHVARAVVDAAKERRGGAYQRPQPANQPSNESLATAITDLERRLTIAEDRASDAEEELQAAHREIAEQWQRARKIAVGLIVWNGVFTLTLIGIVIYLLVRK
jgi:hypothetical protein